MEIIITGLLCVTIGLLVWLLALNVKIINQLESGNANEDPGRYFYRKDSLFTETFLVVKSEGGLRVIDKEKISYVYVLKGETCIVSEEERIYIKTKMSELVLTLNSSFFVKVHRSYIININQIKEINTWFNQTLQLKMTGDGVVPVSRSYLKNFKKKIGIE